MTAAEVLERGDEGLRNRWIEWHRGGNWFTSDLLKTMFHADATNLERFRAGFPDETEVIHWYRYGRRSR